MISKIDQLLDLQSQAREKMWELRWRLLLEQQLHEMGVAMDDVSSIIRMEDMAFHGTLKDKMAARRIPRHIGAIKTKNGVTITLKTPIPA